MGDTGRHPKAPKILESVRSCLRSWILLWKLVPNVAMYAPASLTLSPLHTCTHIKKNEIGYLSAALRLYTDWPQAQAKDMTATADMHQARPLCMSTGTQHRKRSDFNLACFNYLVSFSLCISAPWMHWHTIKTKTHSHWNSLIHLEVVKTSPWPRDLLLGYVRISKAHQHLTWQGLNKVTHTHTGTILPIVSISILPDEKLLKCSKNVSHTLPIPVHEL